MAFTPSPQLPPRGARTVFSNAVDAFVKWLIALPAQLDAFLARLEAIAAGGAYAFSFNFNPDTDLSTLDTVPGWVRLNNAIPAQSTVISFSGTSGAGNDITSTLNSWAESSSAVKGNIRISSKDGSRYVIFRLVSVTIGQNSTVQMTVTAVAQSTSPVAKFTSGEMLNVFFQRTGDKGDVGNADKKVQTAPAPVGGVVTVDYRNGNCLVWNPASGSTSTLSITNWPAAGTLGEFWIIGANLGAATVNTNTTINWLRPDGTFANNTSINTNHGATLRTAGEDNVLLWGRNGAPSTGKVAR